MRAPTASAWLPSSASMLARAKAAGQLRPDVTETDVGLMRFMLTAIADIAFAADPAVWRRYLRIVLDGLGTPDPGEMPAPPLDQEALDEVIRALPQGR